MKKFGIVELPEGSHSHFGHSYTTSSAQYVDEMADTKGVLRQVQSLKDSCDASASDKGKTVKYYHITVQAVFEE